MADETTDDDDARALVALSDDRAMAADVLLAEAHLSLVRADERANRVETKASWLISGLVPAFTVIALGVLKQAHGMDFNDPIDVAMLSIGTSVVFLLVAATLRLLRVIDLVDFGLVARDWTKAEVEAAEQFKGKPAIPLKLGLAHSTLSSADTAAERANGKVKDFKPAMRLITIAVWCLVPYAAFLLIDLARTT